MAVTLTCYRLRIARMVLRPFDLRLRPPAAGRSRTALRSSKIERVLVRIGLIDAAAHFEHTLLGLFFSLVGASQVPIIEVPVRSAWTTAPMSWLVL